MPSAAEAAIRTPSLIEFQDHTAQVDPGLRHWTARAQNFAVTLAHVGGEGACLETRSPDEAMVLVPDAPATLYGAASLRIDVPPRSVCILPPGGWRIALPQGGRCAVLRSLRENAGAAALNEGQYAERDARIAPVGPAWPAARAAAGVRVIRIDEVSAPADRPRLKMLQSATLSINWVEYEGPRDRSALSPHAHPAFEQGSLALAGEFVHHLRVPWGADANLWQEDRHVRLGSPSLMVVPVGLIHTSEGVGTGRHLLIDVFSPPRADFIAKGWVANSADYAQPPQ
jgi:hypothetical protein